MFNSSIYQPQATQDKDLMNLKTFLDKLSNNIGLYKQDANAQQATATLMPSNLFKMPIYQLWQGTPSGQAALKQHCSTMIPTDDHRKIWQLCDQMNPNPQEYVTDVLYGLNSVEQRQNQGKDRIEKLEKHLDTLGTEIEKTNAALKSSLNDRLKKLQMQNSKLIGMVLQCYSLMESINGKYYRQSQGMNQSFESNLKTELSNIENQVVDAETKCHELKMSAGPGNEDDFIKNKNSQDLSALFGLTSSASAGQASKDLVLKPEAATFLDAVTAMKGYISQIQEDIVQASREIDQIDTYFNEYGQRQAYPYR